MGQPKPSPVPASHPTMVTGKVLFLFLFLCFSHQLGTFRGWAAPFPSQHHGAPLGRRAVPPHPRSVPKQQCDPCNSVTLHVPVQMMPPPRQQCPLPGRCPLQRHSPFDPLSSPHQLWESCSGTAVRCRVARRVPAATRPSWHRGPSLRSGPESSALK